MRPIFYAGIYIAYVILQFFHSSLMLITTKGLYIIFIISISFYTSKFNMIYCLNISRNLCINVISFKYFRIERKRELKNKATRISSFIYVIINNKSYYDAGQ